MKLEDTDKEEQRDGGSQLGIKKRKELFNPMINTFMEKRALQLTKEGDKILNEASSDEAIKESDLLYDLATQLYDYTN